MSRALQLILAEARRKPESPKSIMKAIGNPDIASLLEYAPEDFRRAYYAKQTAEWDPDFAAEADWSPSPGDHYEDEETGEERVEWWRTAYYPVYRTEDGKIYEEVHSVDGDGNHEYEVEAEVGTDEWRRQQRDWYQAPQRLWKDYWEYVAETGDDALGEIFVPREKTTHKWVAGFTQEPDGRLKFWGARPIGREQSHPPIRNLDEVPQHVKDYLLVDQDGYSEATLDDLKRENGKQDKQGRWQVWFTTEQEKEPENVVDFIKRKAREQLERQ